MTGNRREEEEDVKNNYIYDWTGARLFLEIIRILLKSSILIITTEDNLFLKFMHYRFDGSLVLFHLLELFNDLE